MKKILNLFFGSLIILGFLNISAFADEIKGQKYYLKHMKKLTHLKGGEFAKQHTSEEWNVLFKNDAKGLILEYTTKFPDLKKYLNGKKFKSKYSKHIKDFLINYSSDSGNVPSC